MAVPQLQSTMLAPKDHSINAFACRLSCMPGPSGLPNTLASYGAELQSATRNNTSSMHSLEPGSPVSDQCLDAETTCSDKLPECVAVEAGMSHPEVSAQECLIGKHPSAAQPYARLPHPAAKGSPNPDSEGNCAEPGLPVDQQQQSAQAALLLGPDEVQLPSLMEDASGHRPQLVAVLPAADAPPSMTAGLHAAADVATDDVSPRQSQHTAPNLRGVTTVASPKHSHQPAVTPAAVTNDDACSMHSQHAAVDPPGVTSHEAACMQVPAHEDATIPDSVGPTQRSRHTNGQRQATLSKSLTSSQHSQPTSDNASLEAALALAALASGDKHHPAARPQDRNVEKAEVPTRSRRRAAHQQCVTDRVPLRSIQRTAAIQRQPLKPAWQHSGPAEPSWGAKGRRTQPPNPNKLPHRDKSPMRRNRDARNGPSRGDKQADSSTAVAASGSEAGSQSATDQVDTSEQSQGMGAHPGSTDCGARVSSRGRVRPLGSKHTSRKQQGGKASADDGARPWPEVHGSGAGLMADQQQPQHRSLNGTTVGNGAAAAAADGDGDDDDDFKPDVRRRAKSHQSPKGSRKRAKLSGACPGSPPGEVSAGAHASAVGQVLLSWEDAERCWEQRIITSFDASQVRTSLCT